MKRIIKYCLIIICLTCLVSCGRKIYDYSVIPQQSLLRGDLKEDLKIFLERTNFSKNEMTGTLSFVGKQAIVEAIPFTANPLGNVTFEIDNESFDGRISIDRDKFTVILPRIPEYKINKQKVNLNLIYRRQSKKLLKRYEDEVFSVVEPLKDVHYGTADGFYTSKPIDKVANDDYMGILENVYDEYKSRILKNGLKPVQLFMDIYKPQNDPADKRPVFLFVHGGASLFGDKQNGTQKEFTDLLVKRGYVVVSINYRLGSTLMGVEAIERTIYRGVQDVNAALRYLSHHKEELRIDMNNIYLGGCSAGAIIALTAANMDRNEIFNSAKGSRLLVDLGGLYTSGNDYTDIVQVAGVVSMWGALVDMNIIDRLYLLPTLLIHGTDDDIVRNGSGWPFKNYMGEFLHNLISSSWKLHGSQSIYDYMKQNSLPVSYVPIVGYGHEPHINADGSFNRNLDLIKSNISVFLRNNVLAKTPYTMRGKSDVFYSDDITTYRMSNTENKNVYWQVEGGFIINEEGQAVQVVWYDTEKTGSINAFVEETDGIAVKIEKKVKIDP